MTNTNLSIELRRELLSNLLATYEKRVYDVAYRDTLRPLLEADMPQLLETPNFDAEVDERLSRVGIFPTAFEHEDSRRIELRRLISATFHGVATTRPGWVFQDVHAHGVAASGGVKPGDELLAINDAPVQPPDKAHGFSPCDIPTRFPEREWNEKAKSRSKRIWGTALQPPVLLALPPRPPGITWIPRF